MTGRCRALASALLVLGSAPQLVGQSFPLARFERYLVSAMATARVPGVSVAIVQGDSVVLVRGYGLRDAGRQDEVDAGTVFAIGSATKSFTATAIAMLVDEQRLAWDDRVASLLPGFQVTDPYVTRELTVRDLLSHRSGLPRCDIWYGAAISRQEVLRRMRFCPQATGFRSGFGYQNVMYLAAGQLIPAIGGGSWDQFIQDRMLQPLGMRSTTTSIRDIAPGRAASPHAVVNGVVRPVPWRNLDNIAPAGSINSTAEDLAAWLRFLLRRGEAGGRRLVSPERLKDLWTPVTVMVPEAFPQWRHSPLLAYGVGWVLWSHRGRLVVEHSGGIDGMSSDVALMPELGLGIAVLSNLTESPLPGALVNWAFDAVLGFEPADWVGELVAAQDRDLAEGERVWVERARAREREATPARPPANYVGRYADSLVGPALVTERGGSLVLTLPEQGLDLPLTHWSGESFIATWPEYRLFGQRALVSFEPGPGGVPVSLTIEGMGRLRAVP